MEELNIPTDPEERRRAYFRSFWRWVLKSPEDVNAILEEHRREVAEQDMLRFFARPFERKLGRRLAAGEQAVLAQRLGALGSDRIADVVLDLPRDALAAWLGDPAAR